MGNITVYTDEFIENEARELLKWCENEDNIYLIDFCEKRKFHDSHLSAWAKKNTVFCDALKFAKMVQRNRLVKGGLYETTNPGFTKFILVNNHKEHFKPESQIQSDEIAQAVVQAIDYKNSLPEGQGWVKPIPQDPTS